MSGLVVYAPVTVAWLFDDETDTHAQIGCWSVSNRMERLSRTFGASKYAMPCS